MNRPYQNLIETKYLCPICNQKLHSADSGKDRGIWCSRKSCQNIGANEGAYGKTDKEAFKLFESKMGIKNLD